ncbi:sel1 repeat family protein, partial [Rodentibacter caecimuris]
MGFQLDKEYQKALEVFHQGVKNGSSSSASTLVEAFSGKQKEGGMDFLNLSEDLERARRYDMIWKYLAYKDYLQPKVPDLDDIVPLPPAPLPEWDGKIAFQR